MFEKSSVQRGGADLSGPRGREFVDEDATSGDQRLSLLSAARSFGLRAITIQCDGFFPSGQPGAVNSICCNATSF